VEDDATRRANYTHLDASAAATFYKVSAAGYRPEKGQRGFYLHNSIEGDAAVVDFTLGRTRIGHARFDEPNEPDDQSYRFG